MLVASTEPEPKLATPMPPPSRLLKFADDFGWRIDRDVYGFVLDLIAPDDGSGDRCTAHSAVEIDTGWPGRCCVVHVGPVAGDVVVDDVVAVEVVGRQPEVGADVAVKGYAGKAVVQDWLLMTVFCR